MPAKPKPTKAARLRAKASKKSGLVAYRRTQCAIVIERDADLCVICYFKHNRIRMRQEIHHVYSRGRETGDWREHYTSLMCVCKECHPLPIQVPGASANLGWVEDILRMANETPIDPAFKKEYYDGLYPKTD